MDAMSQIPRANGLDSTLALASEGYAFISERCRQLDTDVFETRFLLRPVICMRGEAAARLFYDSDRFQRMGAAPGRVKKTLFGQGGVQGLDGAAHRRRKEMFMSLMTAEHIEQLVDVVSDQWHRSIERWEDEESVVLFDEVRKLLCQGVCAWAGVPLPKSEVERRTADLGAMIDGAGAIGLQHWQGRWARTRAEWWIGELIESVRTNQMDAPEDSALQVISQHRTQDGDRLNRQIAAVELLNLLRPTMDVARYVVFAALALHEHPEYKHQLQEDENDTEHFVQEVRRLYPFFPFVAARVRRSFTWNGYRFREGRHTLLDLYGTNHDPRLWEQPDTFRPERFRHREENPFDFIPQGGGDYTAGHRCAGEWITIALMNNALDVLLNAMHYDVPEQDLRIPLSRMPALPNSRLVIRDVQRKRTQ